jgi:hypothetical protein
MNIKDILDASETQGHVLCFIHIEKAFFEQDETETHLALCDDLTEINASLGAPFAECYSMPCAVFKRLIDTARLCQKCNDSLSYDTQDGEALYCAVNQSPTLYELFNEARALIVRYIKANQWRDFGAE